MLRNVITPGDTYEKYQRRCEAMGLTPKNFIDWLNFEVKVEGAGRTRGYQPKRDGAVAHVAMRSN